MPDARPVCIEGERLRINVRDTKLGDKLPGLGAVQTYMECGEGLKREARLYGDWGWCLTLPIGRGRCDIDVERTAALGQEQP